MFEKNPEATTATTKGFLTAVFANTALLLVEVGLFLVLKQRLARIYRCVR